MRYFFFYLFALYSFSLAIAQVDHPGMRHFGTAQGLPSSQVYDILQDRQGYVWISTDYGICRFNGYEFKQYGFAEGLKDPVILHLFEDHLGQLWGYSFQGEVYVRKDEVFETPAFLPALKTHLYNQPGQYAGASWIYVDQQERFYVSRDGGGIIRVSGDTLIEQLPAEPSLGYVALYRGEELGVGFCSRAEPLLGSPSPPVSYPIRLLDSAGGRKALLPWPHRADWPPIRLNTFLQPKRASAIVQLPEQLIQLSLPGLEVVAARPYSDGVVLSYLESKQTGRLYLGHWTGDRGVAVYSGRKALFDVKAPMRLLPGKVISHLMEDRDGGIWIGTNQDGVYYLPDPDLNFNLLQQPELRKIEHITAAGPDKIWASTQENRIFLVEGKRIAQELPPSGLRLGKQDVYFDSSGGRLWASGTLKYWDGKRWAFPAQASPAGGHPGRYFNLGMAPSNADTNCLLLFNAASFFSMDCRPPYPISPVVQMNPPQRIFGLHQCICHGTLIAAMNGLYRYSAEAGIEPVMGHEALRHRIQVLAEKNDGTLFIGTKGGGLLIWTEGGFEQLTRQHGLPSDYIDVLHVDPTGQAWVGTKQGLSRIRKALDGKWNIQNITVQHGLPSGEINDIASSDSLLWAATQNGTLRMALQREQREALARPPVIEGFRANSNVYPLEAPIRLNWGEQNLSITVAALNFAQGDKATYRFRFGPSEDWQLTQNPIIRVARPTYGKYNFEVQAKGRGREWSRSAMLAFFIATPYWKTWWFIGAIGLILSGLVTFSLLRRSRQMQLRQQQQSRLERLEREMEQLRQQAYQAQMNPHFIYNCLTAIQSYILEGGQGMLTASDYLSKFARLIRQALNASRFQSIPLQEDIDTLRNYIELEQFRFDNRFDYQVNVSPEVDSYHCEVPPMLIQPFVENAILHGLSPLQHRRGRLVINYNLTETLLEVSVIDNGIGVFQSQSARAFTGREHQPAGMDISRRRLSLAQNNSGVEAVRVEELRDGSTVVGTKVQINIPI